MPHGGNTALSYLLSSNAVPNPCEAASIQAEIDSLTSQISELRARLKKREKNLRLYRATLSPVRRVPAEIWAEIFAFVLPQKLFDKGDREELMDLQLVCKTWRNAARLKHRLWSGLFIGLDGFPPVEKIVEWLSRSAGVPRSLRVDLRECEDCEEQDSPCRAHNSALAALLANGGSLHHLSLVCRDPQCFQILLDSLEAVDGPLTNRPWDSLRSLTCTFLHEWTESPDPSKSIFMSLPPNITSFELRLPEKYSAFSHESESAAIPLNIPPRFLEQLTSFSLSSDWEGLKWLECTLPFCTNVENLSIDFDYSWWQYEGSRNDVQQRLGSGFLLPKVRTLSLQNVFSPSLDILSFLKTPHLVDLDISAGDNGEDMDCELTDLVLQFIKRSNCEASFRCFRLRNTRLDAEQLADTLRGLPFLTHLTLEDVAVVESNYRDVFGLLKEDVQPSLQHLEVLELLNLDHKFSKFSLVKFLESRRPFTMENGKPSFEGPPDTLKRLKVTFEPAVNSKRRQHIDTDDVIQVLKKWCGVSVHIGPITYVD
ncbi:hypothetical protein EST38_g2205 [Candolleomyces aberdarensis]|uniref:Uncharacterized protein n=1 Tax=Candolleomyces aberdarensis TaxID=2316362 RepID=A0A4Q2DXC0_9AGAR|nr:hypothetical protein EST38_g2205 [Candolleomyces aberdarensis]